jgi:putative ABC transport system permease protein
VEWRGQVYEGATIVGVSPDYQVVQDYEMVAGEPLTDIDVRLNRRVAVLGADVARELFGSGIQGVGQDIRIAGRQLRVKAVVAPKGSVAGQSLDNFVLLPHSVHSIIWGRRTSYTFAVKMPDAESLPGAMERAEEAMRVAHRLRPATPNDFVVQTAEALVAFWTNITRLLFTVVPAVVTIGVVVGGIVIMNIMLMSVTERTREIGIRKAVGATQLDVRRQFLAESIALSVLGGLLGLASGALLATVVDLVSPLPARVTPWSAGVALGLGLAVGIVFGVYPATRAARLDPVEALRAE